MLKRSFFGLSKPRFCYETIGTFSKEPIFIPKPKVITMYIEKTPTTKVSSALNVGKHVKTGERIFLSKDSNSYAVSSVSGTISSISDIVLDYGSTFTAISINTSELDEPDESFLNAYTSPTLKIINDFLNISPSKKSIKELEQNDSKIDNVIIYGGNIDLFSNMGLVNIINNTTSFNTGIKILRDVTKVKNFTVIIPMNSMQNYSDHFDAEIKVVEEEYPHAQPPMIMYKMTGQLPGMLGTKTNNFSFLQAETIIEIGKAFETGKLPTRKIITVFDKEKKHHIVNVLIGTHVEHILKYLNIKISNHDKIIFGGPMTGTAIYSEKQPITSTTNSILLQSKETITHYSDYPCINCGECIRVCPANVPVNLLVRFLEAGHYNDGADLYDLHSCVECGLCSYVCVSKIPIYQYIKLAKYELTREE